MAVYRIGEVKISGLKAMRNAHEGKTAVIVCSGTSVKDLDIAEIPDHAVTFAVNEGITKLGERADYWVLSDNQIVLEYADKCPEGTTVLCMHEATRIIHRYCKKQTVFTVQSMSRVREYDNEFEFFSRGTVMIGGIEMARYMGIKRFFIFGLDCFRHRDAYYFDNRKPKTFTENQVGEFCRVVGGVPAGARIYVTPRLRRMVEKLEEVRVSGLWKGTQLYCVNSPLSQQRSIPLITMEQFHEMAAEEQPVERKKKPPQIKIEITDIMWNDAVEALRTGCQGLQERGEDLGETIEKVLEKVNLGTRTPTLYRQCQRALEVLNDAQWDE